jgi:ClpX C4-type zinc finger
VTTKPPPLLASARVLEYAVVDESVGYSGKSWVFVGDRELGRVPRLAVCEAFETGESLLLYCSEDWEVLAAAKYDSPSRAKARAERTYPGVARCWVNAGVSREEALALSEQESRALSCSFCGRKPEQVRNLIVQGDSRICNICVAQFTRTLAAEREGE